MKRTILITGSASGIGRATALRLSEQGHRVIGVDRADADICVDLSTEQGRAHLVVEAMRLCPNGIDGVVAGAGIAHHTDMGMVAAVNYFGAVATLEGLRPLLAQSASPRAVAIVSTAALMPVDDALVAACLAGDEAGARSFRPNADGVEYASSKYALARWLRRAATSADWAGSRILLNGVGPGLVKTAMTEAMLTNEVGLAILAKATPIALSRCPYGEPEYLAEVIGFLLTVETSYLVGQILFTDGGTDALFRPDSI